MSVQSATPLDVLNAARELRAGLGEDLHDHLSEALYTDAALMDRAVIRLTSARARPDRTLDCR